MHLINVNCTDIYKHRYQSNPYSMLVSICSIKKHNEDIFVDPHIYHHINNQFIFRYQVIKSC